MRVPIIVLAVSLALAGSAGFLTSQAISQGGSEKTVTIDVGKGEKGDPGPAGPPGPRGEKGDPGGTTCPDGYVFGKLIVNHGGGRVTIFTCMTPDSD